MKETMEIVQGKQKDKKVVVAQEIAFAKVLAGNNKTLRDRAVKKLRKWLTVRGNGKWAFTEEEFLRIWTGLFYCMWMSDKFLVQEELAESISQLIHCFRKNSDMALLFIKCFNKRILMDWEGLDQYRIDKFNMLVRRFLRQTFMYCKEKNWEVELLNKLMAIFYNEVLNKDSCLGLVMHFINIYPEELAKVGGGKLSSEIVLILVEPFVKLLARTKEDRIRKETVEFFNYLMQQTDQGIEFEEQFNAWREQGFPGEGPHCMKQVLKPIRTDKYVGNDNEDEDCSDKDDEDDEYLENKPLDPRAGSVHVLLPQIPIPHEGFINLFQKHIQAKQSTKKGRRILKDLTQKFTTLKKGKFPKTIKKDPIIVESKKKKQTVKNAKNLLKFTQSLDEGPIRSKEFENLEEEGSPTFWEKAKVKASKGMAKKGKVFKKPFAETNGSCKSAGLRRISFALEKNMAQENEEYLAEVKNSPRVPFDGSKKPVQSALKSGLPPSPVNPFYRYKKIKL